MIIMKNNKIELMIHKIIININEINYLNLDHNQQFQIIIFVILINKIDNLNNSNKII